jgi:hypothetical protein
MIRIPKVTMTMRELDRLKCIRGLISKLQDRPGSRRLKPERAEKAFAIVVGDDTSRLMVVLFCGSKSTRSDTSRRLDASGYLNGRCSQRVHAELC